MTSIRAALRLAQEKLCLSDTPDLDAQLLLARALDTERVYVLAHSDDALDSGQMGRFEALLKRRAAGEPMAYITGHKWFYDLEFLVTPAVLIPRPETELLLEEALRADGGDIRSDGCRHWHGQRRASGDLRPSLAWLQSLCRRCQLGSAKRSASKTRNCMGPAYRFCTATWLSRCGRAAFALTC